MKDIKGNVLVIDDFKANIEYIKRILENEGYTVFSSDNADLSLRLIAQNKFDLILLDVVMPKIDGYELCEKIKKSKINSDTPVIFVTTQRDENSIIKGFKAGAQDFIIRPFYKNELIARVNVHFEHNKYRKELEILNKNLEKQVKIRTRELNLALEELNSSYKNLKEVQKELESLDEAKENFLQIISHEIRTPLNGIIGFSELLINKCKDKEYIDYINMLHESVKRLEHFSMKALLITQLKTGKYVYNFSTINIQKYIHEITSQFDSLTRKNNLKIHYNFEDITLYTDQYLLKSGLINLIENAIKYSPVNGLIKIEATRKAGYNCQIIISDEGNGFPEAILKNKNMIFYNNDFVDNNPGLGLYTTFLIIKSLNGEITLNNKADKGAEVIVRF